MSKVIEEFNILKYKVLKVDKIPKKSYAKIKIKNMTFNLVPIYDAVNCIAIEKNKENDNKFLGEIIEFI